MQIIKGVSFQYLATTHLLPSNIVEAFRCFSITLRLNFRSLVDGTGNLAEEDTLDYVSSAKP